MIISMFVALISSRLVLQALGASDYGLYNVVGGIVTLLSFFSSAMADTTTRFFNFEMGKKNADINSVFNISYVIHIIVAILVLFLLESVGIFYIHNYLNISSGKEADALFVFQISSIVACVGITNVPFRALLVAQEKFGLMAIVEIVNSIIKLFLILLLLSYKGNGLRFYAFAMSTSTLLSFLAYRAISKKLWPQYVEWNFIRSRSRYFDQFSFSIWTLLGNLSFVGRSQGSNLLINVFFSTTVSAAYAISNTVKSCVDLLSANFTKASTPQITKNIGEGNYIKAFSLVCNTNRINLVLSIVTFFTFYIELNFLLHIWLGNTVPDSTLSFCRSTLIMGLVASSSNGITQFVMGAGRIKEYFVVVCIFFLLCLPLGYFLFSIGLPPYSIIWLFIIADLIIRMITLVLLKIFYGFQILTFVAKSWIRPIIILIGMTIFYILYHEMSITLSIYKIAGILSSFALSALLSFYIGLYPRERKILINYCKNIKNKNGVISKFRS